jgi:hypothetical protein
MEAIEQESGRRPRVSPFQTCGRPSYGHFSAVGARSRREACRGSGECKAGRRCTHLRHGAMSPSEKNKQPLLREQRLLVECHRNYREAFSGADDGFHMSPRELPCPARPGTRVRERAAAMHNGTAR